MRKPRWATISSTARAERAGVSKDERAPGRLGLLLGWALEGVILMSHTIWALSVIAAH